MKIRFKRKEEIRNPNDGKIIRAFSEGEIVDTAPDVAKHWIDCGAAECADAAPSAPPEPTEAAKPSYYASATRRTRNNPNAERDGS